MMYSERCRDPKTRWDKNAAKCVPCIIKPGYETTPNCGYDDNGGKHEVPYRACGDRTFNDGSGPTCHPCASCPPGHKTVTNCSSTADTQCQDPRSRTTASYETTHRGFSMSPQTTLYQQEAAIPGALWAVTLAIIMCVLLALFAAWIIHRRRYRGRQPRLSFGRKSSFFNGGFFSLSAPVYDNPPEDLLSTDILAAPLQTVLDNLDVLEELVILLDPESQRAKNTKHLASHCSFPATWITYTYSMKDSRSPLKAVLEGVTSRHPDWTVGHLAKLLRRMERNDAIAVLSRLGHKEGAV